MGLPPKGYCKAHASETGVKNGVKLRVDQFLGAEVGYLSGRLLGYELRHFFDFWLVYLALV